MYPLLKQKFKYGIVLGGLNYLFDMFIRREATVGMLSEC